ncbi:hypothetical protein Hanom_Chr05g00409361 [Helianthus anomalus]
MLICVFTKPESEFSFNIFISYLLISCHHNLYKLYEFGCDVCAWIVYSDHCYLIFRVKFNASYSKVLKSCYCSMVVAKKMFDLGFIVKK